MLHHASIWWWLPELGKLPAATTSSGILVVPRSFCALRSSYIKKFAATCARSVSSLDRGARETEPLLYSLPNDKLTTRAPAAPKLATCLAIFWMVSTPDLVRSTVSISGSDVTPVFGPVIRTDQWGVAGESGISVRVVANSAGVRLARALCGRAVLYAMR